MRSYCWVLARSPAARASSLSACRERSSIPLYLSLGTGASDQAAVGRVSYTPP